jgi:dTDP-4-amino-4,6-dideoxygalactose transaminase
MLTTDDGELADRLRHWRDANFSPKSMIERLRRALYLPAAMAAFSNSIYELTYWLQESTSLLKGLTEAYHLDLKIHFPPDFNRFLSPVEARVGLQQLRKYPFIKSRRREIAEYYFKNLNIPESWMMPPQVEGATYSHFAIRVSDRDRLMHLSAERGVQLGELIEYSMPHLPAYRQYVGDQEFPNSLLCSHSMINLPIHPSLKDDELIRIVSAVNQLPKG